MATAKGGRVLCQLARPIVQAEDRIDVGNGRGRRQAVPKLVSCETRRESTVLATGPAADSRTLLGGG